MLKSSMNYIKKYFYKLFKLSYITSSQLISFEKSTCYNKEEELQINHNQYHLVNSSCNPDWLNLFSSKKIYRGCYYTSLRQVTLVGNDATAVYNGRVLLDSILNSRGYLNYKSERKFIVFNKYYRNKELIENAISLSNPLNNSYFHWVSDALPLLESYFHYRKNNSNKDIKVIVKSPLNKFMEEYLALFDIPRDSIYENKYNKIKVDNYIQPSIRYVQTYQGEQEDWAIHIYPKRVYDFTRNLLLKKVESIKKKAPKKIYISRSDVGVRTVKNEKQLVDFLERYDYQKVILTNLTILEQVVLFSNITHVVAVHGASLTNLIYGDNINLIELYPSNRPLHQLYYYFQISHYYKHQHKVFFCKADCFQNIKVDIDLLKDYV